MEDRSDKTIHFPQPLRKTIYPVSSRLETPWPLSCAGGHAFTYLLVVVAGDSPRSLGGVRKQVVPVRDGVDCGFWPRGEARRIPRQSMVE